MNPLHALPLIVVLLFALLIARRMAGGHKTRAPRPRRAKIPAASVRMSARTEMRALDDAFSVMGSAARPEQVRATARRRGVGANAGHRR